MSSIDLIDLLKTWIPVVVFLGGVFMFVWKLSKAVSAFENGLNILARENDSLKKKVVELTDEFNNYKSESARLEGMHEGTMKALMANVRDLQKATSNIDALWVTLKNLFPGKVPPRTSDK